MTSGKIIARVNDELTERSYVILPIYLLALPIVVIAIVAFIIRMKKIKPGDTPV
jgi:hypothetical protein